MFFFSPSFPSSRDEREMISLTVSLSLKASLLISAENSTTLSEGREESFISSEKPMIVVIGVFSSWDTLAVNSLLILSLSLFSEISLINTTAPLPLW